MASTSADPRALLQQEFRRVAQGPQYDLNEVVRIGAAAHQLGLAREADAALRLCADLLLHFIRTGDIARALVAEGLVYDGLVKRVETEAHYEQAFSMWREAMAAAGRGFRMPLPDPPVARDASRVAFILNKGVVLGHTEVLFRLLESRGAERHARLYVLFGADDAFLARAAALGLPVECYGGTREGPSQWMRARMAANAEACAVWVAAPTAATFMYASRVAPVQIFWTLKHHAIRLPEIDGYLTYGSWGEREKSFHGQRWTVCPVPLALDPRPPDAQRVREARARFQVDRLAGTLAREEKIDSRPFLDSVVELLRADPRCGYLWTGRERHAGIEAFFAQAGVGERCFFVGWVDTPLYAAVLDLFLETFPLGCGITGYQAIAAKVPLLSYLEPNTVFGMQYWSELMERCGSRDGASRAVLDEYPVLAARNPHEYAQLAARLLSDASFRSEWIERERRFHEDEIRDISRYSRRFFAAIDDVAMRVLAR